MRIEVALPHPPHKADASHYALDNQLGKRHFDLYKPVSILLNESRSLAYLRYQDDKLQRYVLMRLELVF